MELYYNTARNSGGAKVDSPSETIRRADGACPPSPWLPTPGHWEVINLLHGTIWHWHGQLELFLLMAPPVAIRSSPQFLTLACIFTKVSSTLSSSTILIWSISQSSTNKIAANVDLTLDMGHMNMKVAPCPFRLCALRTVMLMTAHPAGAAPLPWHRPWYLISILLCAQPLESP
eukprot:scaffold6070_cov41-Cyclotella_meneghiniana.AAC.4